MLVLFFGLFLVTAESLPEPVLPPLQCQEPEECFKQALVFRENNFQHTPTLRELFANLIQKVPESSWASKAKIHLGLLGMDEDPALALEYFRTTKTEFPQLRDYFENWIGESWYRSQDFTKAHQVFREFLKRYPKSILKEKVELRIGQVLYDEDDCPAALSYLQEVISIHPNADYAPEAFLKVGDCIERMGNTQEANKVLQELWWRHPNTLEAQQGVTKLEQILGENKRWIPSVGTQYKRAKKLYQLAFFEEAIIYFQKTLSRGLPIGLQTKARFNLAMAFVRLKRYEEAAPVFQRLVKERAANIGPATVWLAKVYLRQGKGTQLVALRNSLPPMISSRHQAEVFWITGLWFEDQGRIPEAQDHYQLASQLGKGSRSSTDALWKMGWIFYQTQKWDQAQQSFQKMAKNTKDRRYTKQAKYWEARAYEQAGQDREAKLLFQDLASQFPLTYYGQLAGMRLQGQPISISQQNKRSLGQKPPTEASPPPWLTQNVHYQKASELIVLGLEEDAKNEVQALLNSLSLNSQKIKEMFPLLHTVRAYDQALRLASKFFRDDIQRGELDGHSSIWSVAYPSGYLSTIRNYVEPQVDPFLVAGIIREESLYDPKALSPVGAMGLMQLMPKTANRVAGRLGLGAVDRRQLFNAPTNIQIGSQYVAELLQSFDGNVIQAVAAYNAGPPAVRRWTSEFGHSQDDEFVEQISYRETRGYVKRVITSYRTYAYLSSTICWGYSLDSQC
jgi:soluble lytic murein transglycosylase